MTDTKLYHFYVDTQQGFYYMTPTPMKFDSERERAWYVYCGKHELNWLESMTFDEIVEKYSK